MKMCLFALIRNLRVFVKKFPKNKQITPPPQKKKKKNKINKSDTACTALCWKGKLHILIFH